MACQRRFAYDIDGIYFSFQKPAINLLPLMYAGHVVAVRVTCEDADNGFKPTCGSIDELNFRTSPEVWGYFSVKSGGGIHEYSDSQASTSLCEDCF